MGVQNQSRVLDMRQPWAMVMARKTTAKIAAAGRDGRYFQMKYPLFSGLRTAMISRESEEQRSSITDN